MDERAPVLRVIYVAIVSSVFLYAAVLEFVAPQAAAPPPEALLWALLAAAVGSAAAAFVLPALLVRNARAQGGDVGQQRFAASLLRWALSESVAVFGLVVGLLGGPRTWTLGFFLAALVLLAVFHPWRRRV